MLKNPKYWLLFSALFVFLILISVAYKMQINEKKLAQGSPELLLYNNTDAVIHVFSTAHNKYLVRWMNPETNKLLGPYSKLIGAPKTFLRIESPKWDRSITLEFSGKPILVTKKVIENRRRKGRSFFTGNLVAIKIHVDWRFFSGDSGLEVTIHKVEAKKLPNIADYIKKIF